MASLSSSKHSNQLVGEKSPYLLQHAHNPVNWMPWGPAAFEKAKKENKPIFLSIGYSTCHWCHVMAHESFENEEIAAIMNAGFINIKVDREERPDVDRMYMTFIQATSGSGGWPMSVWLTPDLKPFVGGTYFPPTDKYGRPGFGSILQKIGEAWKSNPAKIDAQGIEVIEALRKLTIKDKDTQPVGQSFLDGAFGRLTRAFDAQWGGFSHAPKFPRPSSIHLLFRLYAAEAKGSSRGQSALDMGCFTLRKMAQGGMHDHVGGGFHRYSVDEFWHVPHFEKMLYDQAQLCVAYLEAYQITNDPFFSSVVRDILTYVLRDMTSTEGGFYSAEDADSTIEAGKPEHAEGAFYVWSHEDLLKVLGPTNGEVFCYHYGVEPAGNAPAGIDPHGEFTNKNILIERHPLLETAEKFNLSETATKTMLLESLAVLFDVRAKRPRPHLDDKILTSWNGLMISALARAGSVLGEMVYLHAAEAAAGFIEKNLFNPKSGTLLRTYRKGPSAIEGFADDYAYLIQGLLDIYEATSDVHWLKWAVQLQEKMDSLFFDPSEGGYFSTPKVSEILLRLKEDYDGAEPSPNSITVLNLVRLSRMFHQESYLDKAEVTLQRFSDQLGKMPEGVPMMLCGLDAFLSKSKQIVVASRRDDPALVSFLREINAYYIPNKVVIYADGDEGQKYLSEHQEYLQAINVEKGEHAVHLCDDYTCQSPAINLPSLRKILTETMDKRGKG